MVHRTQDTEPLSAWRPATRRIDTRTMVEVEKAGEPVLFVDHVIDLRAEGVHVERGAAGRDAGIVAENPVHNRGGEIGNHLAGDLAPHGLGDDVAGEGFAKDGIFRSEEHTSELQS